MAPFELRSAPKGVALSPEGQGSFLSVSGGTVLTEALVVTMIASGTLRIEIGPRANAHIVLELAGSHRGANIMLMMNLAEEAVCDFTCLQQMSPESTCTILQKASVGAGAALRSRHVSLGSLKSVHDVNVMMEGHDARSDIDWIAYAKGHEDHHLNAQNWFDAANGRGEILMKSVVEQQANVQEEGKIGIGLGGKGTDAYLTQEVLMLDASAKVNAVPALEIKTNDVKASHSATVARVTAEDLFYFASRGIAEYEARKMYVLGFLGSQLLHISDIPMRERIVSLVEEKYERA
jgi:Fe-S cluster assembly protein SufB